MNRRVTGAVLFGFGLLCVVLAAALAWVIVPTQRQFPFDTQPPDVVVAAPGATFVQAKRLPDGEAQVAVRHGTLASTTGVKPDFAAAADLTGELAGRTLIWNVYQATDWVETGEPINRAESRIALDRKSGAAVPWNGQCHNDVKQDETQDVGCYPGNIQFAGQFYLFPFGTGKQTYQYWDGSLRQALPIAYKAEEDYNGVPTYRFEQVVPQQNLQMDAETLQGLLGFLAPGAQSGTVTYRASRTLWVEPMTGAIVGYREQQHREIVPNVGAPVVMLDATFQYDQPTAKAVREEAQHGRFLLLLLGRYVPIGLLVIGLVAAVIGVLLTRRPAAPAARDPEDVPEPEPTAVPQA